MSFKRDGDDFALLRNLKRRRVSDLLVGHIPEDEALLLKNGRYTCTVCSYRPIFDTIETLSLHRKGKKHLNNLTRYLAQQHEFVLLKQKKEHEAFIETGSTKLSGEKKVKEKSSYHKLLKKKPYSSCQRKLKISIESKNKEPSSLPADESTPATCDNVEPKRPSDGPSVNLLVRTYMKNLQKKRDFSKVVHQSRNNCVQPVQALWKEPQTSRTDSKHESNKPDENASTPSTKQMEEMNLANPVLEEKRQGGKKIGLDVGSRMKWLNLIVMKKNLQTSVDDLNCMKRPELKICK
ncbi:uncharacterized protein LOC143240954 isoform X2 [Tachypleus tridentatus]|uniref:uncharacterized protein LOC143240954 isoform X2 n=1 Tax=Tachypleus tridentatus TaxID=6853 RepID=UPI003FD00677